MVDYVSQDSYIAGRGAAEFAFGKTGGAKKMILFKKGNTIKNAVPQVYRDYGTEGSKTRLSLRVKRPFGRSRVIFRCGGKVVGEIKRQYAVPSEMVRLDVSGLLEKIEKPCEIKIDIGDVN